MVYKVIFDGNRQLVYPTLTDINIRFNLDLADWKLPQIVEIKGNKALVDSFDK